MEKQIQFVKGSESFKWDSLVMVTPKNFAHG